MNNQPAERECSGGESFALRVVGQSMVPEFNDGDIIIVEPGGALSDGAFVLALVDEEWIFRQLTRDDESWVLRPLNPAWPTRRLTDLDAVRGRVIQKAVPGHRRSTRFYV